ncbi:MAG: FHA domain-containing protein [Myxococcales bacterium]|nr:FHA domain-containing protein [Myxococcales bacterium]
MICLLISEKGGAERRELFDQEELTIGRVKGNDVLLPKGNVSKRHARIALRDGRHIVTDLKSTNGTYVNHRKITHATLVRDGDRIYIGDFILSLDDGAATRAARGPDSVTGSHVTGGPTRSSPTPSSPTQSSRSQSGPSESLRAVGNREPHTLAPATPTESAFREEPSSRDVHDSAIDVLFPAPPRVPSDIKATPRARVPTYDGLEPQPSSDAGTGMLVRPSAREFEDRATDTGQRRMVDASERGRLARPLAELVSAVERVVAASALDELPLPSAATALEVARALDGEIGKMADAGTLSAELEPARLLDAASRELLGLGAIGALLEDERVTRVRVLGRAVHVQRHGMPEEAAHLGGYASTTGVFRTLRRLAAAAGQPLGDAETTVERELDDGMHLFAVLPPAAPDGPMVVVQRARAVATNLNALVRSGAISRSMATFFAYCAKARMNVLVAGAPDSGADELLDALIAATDPDAHAVHLVQRNVSGAQGKRILLGVTDQEREAAVRSASRLMPEHLFVAPLSGRPLAALLDAITDGGSGVVLAISSGTLRQSIERLGAGLASARDMPAAAAREWLASAFDIGVEVSRLQDGRPRVVRVVELRAGAQGSGTRDIFTFSFHRMATGGSIEGSFYASGTVPRVVDEIAARGLTLDTSIFRRHPSS